MQLSEQLSRRWEEARKPGTGSLSEKNPTDNKNEETPPTDTPSKSFTGLPILGIHELNAGKSILMAVRGVSDLAVQASSVQCPVLLPILSWEVLLSGLGISTYLKLSEPANSSHR